MSSIPRSWLQARCRRRGYRCVFTAFPESGKAGVIMTNGQGGEAVVDKALVMIARHFGWPAIGPMKE